MPAAAWLRRFEQPALLQAGASGEFRRAQSPLIAQCAVETQAIAHVDHHGNGVAGEVLNSFNTCDGKRV